MVPISKTLSMAWGYQEVGTVNSSDHTVYPDPDLRAALIASLAGTSTSSIRRDYYCNSVQCLFPENAQGYSYSSVGVSSECFDVSSFITQIGPRNWTDQTNLTDTAATTYTFADANISYLLKDDIDLDGHDRWNQMLAMSDLTYDPDLNLSTYLPDLTERQKVIVENSPSRLAFLMPKMNPCQVYIDYQDYFGNETSAMSPVDVASCPELDLPGVDTLPGFFAPTAALCLFYGSVQHLNGTSGATTIMEEKVGEPVPLTMTHIDDSGPYTTLGSVSAQIGAFTFLDPCLVDDITIYNFTEPYMYDLFNGSVTVANVTGSAECLYGMSQAWFSTIVAALPDLIRGDAPAYDCMQVWNYTSMSCYSSWWLNGAYAAGNASSESINEFLALGLDALSYQLRTYSSDWDGSSVYAKGSGFDTSVCIHFNRPWLIYPLVLTVGVLILLVCVIVSTAGLWGSHNGGSPEVIWKSSLQPLLYYGLEDSHRRYGAAVASKKELGEKAKRLKVRFDLDEDGWRFHDAAKDY